MSTANLASVVADGTGIHADDILSIAAGIAAMIQRDGGAECYAAADEAGQIELARAYMTAYERQARRMALELLTNADKRDQFAAQVLNVVGGAA